MILRNNKRTTETESLISNDINNTDDSSSTSSNSRVIDQRKTSSFSSNYFDFSRLKDEQRKDPDIQKIISQLNLSTQLFFCVRK